MRNGALVKPELFDLVTLLFSDIPGFTFFVAHHPPVAVTSLLIEVDKLFDDILMQFPVYKVESISDCYMVNVLSFNFTVEGRQFNSVT